MSNYRAIAGVTASLRNLLRDRMESPVTVTIAPPDVLVDGLNAERVNLYLYQVNENEFLKNQEIPGQGSPSAYGHPPLSLNLHYLLTAHGSSETAETGDLEAQEILGDAMRVLHDFAIVTDRLSIVRPSVGTVGDPLLDPSLLGEFEQVKLSLHPLSLEALNQIWSALPNSNFRRSVAYEASAVQIESLQLRSQALPVRERRVYALPFRSPQIAEVYRTPEILGARSPAAEVGDTLRLQGTNLAAFSTIVLLGTQSAAIVSQTPTQLDVTVPGTLSAGIHPVHAVHELMLPTVEGQPDEPHRVFRSNTLAFQLIPQIASIAPASAGPGDLVTVTVNPPVTANQDAYLLLGDYTIPANAVAPDAPPRTAIEFTLPAGSDAIPAGDYFLRVRVDGAESRLDLDPLTGLFTGPLYTLT